MQPNCILMPKVTQLPALCRTTSEWDAFSSGLPEPPSRHPSFSFPNFHLLLNACGVSLWCFFRILFPPGIFLSSPMSHITSQHNFRWFSAASCKRSDSTPGIRGLLCPSFQADGIISIAPNSPELFTFALPDNFYLRMRMRRNSVHFPEHLSTLF